METTRLQDNETFFKMQQQNHTIILFGEVVVDEFPEKSLLGGAPFNVARHLRAFGLNPILITRTGNDKARKMLMKSMEQFHLDVRGIQSDTRYPTGRVVVQEEKQGHSFNILPNQAYDHIHAGLARLVSLSVHPELLYFGTLAQRTRPSRRALNLLTHSLAIPKILDVNLRAPWIDPHILHRSLQQADILKINDEELEVTAKLLQLRQGHNPDHAYQLMQRYPLQQLIVTCGKNGAWLLNQDGTECHADQAIQNSSIVDTVGAGDGFSAAFILGLLSKWPAPLSLARANQFATSICTIRGAIPPDLEFYLPFLKEWGVT